MEKVFYTFKVSYKWAGINEPEKGYSAISWVWAYDEDHAERTFKRFIADHRVFIISEVKATKGIPDKYILND